MVTRLQNSEFYAKSLGTILANGTTKKITATVDEINQLDASSVGATKKIKKISFTAADFADNDEVGTGWPLPDNAIVTNVFLNVKTVEATASTKTVNIGTDSTDGGDADGYLAGASVATKGLVKGTLLNSGQTLGALLRVDEGGTGELVPEPDVTMGGVEITATAGDAEGFTEAVFDVLIEYIEVA